MRLVDGLTILALVLGPILAVATQLAFERRREIRRRKIGVLDTLMSYRGRFVHSDNVRAMNLVDVVFYDNEEVRSKFTALLKHLDSDSMKADEPSPDTISRAEDLAAELISAIAKDIGYSFDHTVIKRQAYHPRAFNVEEKYKSDVRHVLLPLLRGESSLRVREADK